MSEQDRTPSTLPTFDSLDPATGEVIASHPVHGPADVAAAVDAARIAALWWADLGFTERRRRLLDWRGSLARRAPQLAQLVHRETGKPVADATLEILLTLEHLTWAATHARRVLRRRSVSPGLLMANQAASVEYLPYGVIGVIGPWNYPVYTPMGSIGYALAAGNAVVFKPSELTPGVGAWLADSLAAVVPDQPLLQVVTGPGETGGALARSGVDKLAFTGSTATGKRVMAACAETLTPVLMECGGKDVLIVDSDADVPAAVEAALWGGMSNAGQTCIGTERVYVVDAVYEEFVALLAERARDVRPGEDRRASYGPMTRPEQSDVVAGHVGDALARGATTLIGGEQSVRPPYVDPVVLVDVPEDAAAVQEETFGPTLTVARVRDVDEAVDRANATRYGLAASVFGRARGVETARRIRSGMASVNSVIAFTGVGALPFGGVGESGFGRIHGADGLREFTRPQSVTRQRFRSPLELTTFARTDRAMDVVEKIIVLRYGSRRR